MAEDESEDEGPAVELGDGESVEGVPLAQVSARLMWGAKKSYVQQREGDTTIRTPDAPQELGDVLEEVEETYFQRRQEFEDSVREVIGTGPVPTAE